MTYNCEECGASFSKVSQLKQHQRTENHWTKHPCDICEKWFTRKDNLDQHKKKHFAANSVHCDECGLVFSRQYTLNRHKERVHQVGGQKRRASNAMGNEEDNDTKPVKMLRKDDDLRQFYSIRKLKEQRISKFGTTSTSYHVTFRDMEVSNDVLSTLKRLFTAIIADLT
ncbi:hypothetical protein ACF0H5_014095 [Mactra antiquata]